ncbi:MAG TPA: TonB family protein [Gemmatimonadales bacterium]|jgi:TonB family protein|nr:TonB family protein [Gemmatimonadales bacterium]
MRGLAIGVALLTLSILNSARSQERRCRETITPKKLPPASRLLDSARAVGELTALKIPAKGLLFSLIYNEEDSLPQTHPLEAAAPEAAIVLAQSLRALKPTSYWGVRVRVVGGETPRLMVERSMYCPPMPTGVQARSERVLVQTRPGDPALGTGTIVRMIAEAQISEAGEVWSVRILRSSGERALDDEFLRTLRIRRFSPALVDGFPVPSWYRTDGLAMKL